MRKIIYILLMTLNFVFLSFSAEAAASFSVNTFSCTPEEVSINNDFSCTAQIINDGDASGSVSVATLYSDSNNWLENSNYAQSSGVSVDPGQTTEVTFSGMRSIKSGSSNGFSKITLDSATDTDGVDGVSVNVIDVALIVSNSVSSAAASATFDTTAEITAGGNIDVSLIFSVSSGGCSIGNQASTKTINGMTDNDRQSRSWTVTMGTTGNCAFSITASATGSAGTATKSDSVSSSVTCSSGCSSGSSSSSSSSGGGGSGGGGGGVGSIVREIGEISDSVQQIIGKGEYISFSFGGATHSISILNISDVSAEILVRSQESQFILGIGEEKNIDFEDDGKEEINIKLDTINVITRRATLIITPLYKPVIGDGSVVDSSGENEAEKKDSDGINLPEVFGKINYLWIFGLLIGIVVILIGIYLIRKYHRRLRHGIVIKPGKYLHTR